MNTAFLGRGKKAIKSRLKGVAAWRDRTFFAFTPRDLEAALRGLGLGPGDTVLVHSSFDAFRGFQGKPSDVLEVLQTLVTPSGLLMMPTLGFQGTAVEFARKNPVVNLARLPSRMGLITELFRRLPGVWRSLHPTHPIALWGADAPALAAEHRHARTPCGDPSPLYRLLERRGKILLLGTDFDVLTFYHSLEELLEARLPVRPFTDEVFELQVTDGSGGVWSCRMRLFDPAVSRRRRLGGLAEELRRLGTWREGRVGRLPLVLMTAPDVLAAMEGLLTRGISCYE